MLYKVANGLLSSGKIARICGPQQFKRFTSSFEVATPIPNVCQITFDNSKKKNAITLDDFQKIGDIFRELRNDVEKRCIIYSTAGDTFSSGIDYTSFAAISNIVKSGDISRVARKTLNLIDNLQQSFLVVSQCHKPVIMNIQGPCIGGGINLACFADMRYCTSNSFFQIKEIVLGIPVDLGCLPLFPKLVNNNSRALELIYTGRKFYAEEALELGFVSKIFDTKDEMEKYSLEMAADIAEKSPVAIDVLKKSLQFSETHSVAETLSHLALQNSVALQGQDFTEALTAMLQKSKATFENL